MNRTKALRDLATKMTTIPFDIYIDGPTGNFAKNHRDEVRYKLAFRAEPGLSLGTDSTVCNIAHAAGRLPDAVKVYTLQSHAAYRNGRYWSVIVWFKGRSNGRDAKPAVAPKINLGEVIAEHPPIAPVKRTPPMQVEALERRLKRLLPLAEGLTTKDVTLLALLVGMQMDVDFISDTCDDAQAKEIGHAAGQDGVVRPNIYRAAGMMEDTICEVEFAGIVADYKRIGIDLTKIYGVKIEVKTNVDLVHNYDLNTLK